MRLALLAVWVLVLLAVLLPFLRRVPLGAPRPPRAPLDELVKDPVCQTYVVRSRAVLGVRGPDGPYFCSAECARRHATGV